jgi:hypothetical protein
MKKSFTFLNNSKKILYGRFALWYFGLLFLIFITGCAKDDFKSDSQTIQIKQNIIYKGVTYNLEGTYDTITKQVNYTSKPEALLEFGKDTNIPTVTHVILYEDRTDIYLYDDTPSFKANVKFGDGNPNRLKSLNGARCNTYDGLQTLGNTAWYYGTNFRTLTNPNYGKLFFSSVWGYGNSVPWVGSAENDAISAITLEDFNTPSAPWVNSTVERVNFQGCQHINWGGSRLYITLASGKIGIGAVKVYPFKLWGWLPWETWDNTISSYEIVQANVWVGGISI